MIFGNESDKMNVEKSFETYWQALDEMQRRVKKLNGYGYTSLESGIGIHHNKDLSLTVWGFDLHKYTSDGGRYTAEINMVIK